MSKSLPKSLCQDSNPDFCSFSDLLHCSHQNEFNCTENWHRENCGQLETNPKYQNFGCKFEFSEELDNVECSNRVDKRELLFKKAPVITGRTYESRNFNRLLSFDDNYIYCGHRNVSFQEFDELTRAYPNENCILKDGKMISLESLWSNLITDFSFKEQDRMDYF